LLEKETYMTKRPQIQNRSPLSKKKVFQIDREIIQIFQQGLSSHQRGQLAQAKIAYEKVLKKQPKHFDCLHLLGVIALQTKNPELAEDFISRAIEVNANFPSAYSNRGMALKELKRFDDALASYDKAIALKPDYADALYNRGNTLKELKRLDDALASYDKAIAHNPERAEAFYNRGIVLQEVKRLDDALASYDKALTLKPYYAEAFLNRGNALKELRRLDDALASYEDAISLKPDYAEAFHNRANALKELKRFQDALESYNNAFIIKPKYEFLYGAKIHTQMHLCDWSNLDKNLNEIEYLISLEQKTTAPFYLLGLIDKSDLQLNASRIYINDKHKASSNSFGIKSKTSCERIRIGYFSADFHNHATSFLMAELFEEHDAHKFELYGFSFGPEKQDDMRNRVSRAFDHFIDVNNKSDHEIAQLSRDIGIDIAVDLKGFTQDYRMGIFAEYAAPIQVSYLGYPGTLAAPYFDYLVADKILIPPESQQYYSEKIIYMPHSYQANDSKKVISSKLFTKKHLGLPESGFVFCCFNNNYKILPETFDVWMRLLKKVSGSVLWLLEDNPTAAKNLRKEAGVRGVDPARLVFAPRMKLDEHLARHRYADLFLDTLPYNAHTTASDALWAGLPVLTQMGQSFAARVAASLLNAMDLPELITKTQEEYESRAIELANDPLQLAQIKKKLEQNRETSPLFNGQLFARHMEAAYAEIHRRHLNGEKPDHIDVKLLVE
jgi:predicted O-linked N-acetylglucosamine transferase (SPINDLY family)